MTTLRTTISQLASEFASGVLDAIRGASLQEILAESGGTRAPAGARGRRGRPTGAAEAPRAAAPATRRGRGGRLGRRSAGDIAGLVEQIVSLLQSNPGGLRAEQIREQLGLEAKELPRPIAEALGARKIAKQGQKRATTYFAKGTGGGGGGPAKAKSAKSTKSGGAGGAKRGRAKSAAGSSKKTARGGKRGGKKRGKASSATNGAAVAS